MCDVEKCYRRDDENLGRDWFELYEINGLLYWYLCRWKCEWFVWCVGRKNENV